MMKYQLMSSHATAPTRGTEFSAGWDLYTISSGVIPCNGKKFDKRTRKILGSQKGKWHGPIIIYTQLQFEIPEGHVGIIMDRSSLAFHGLHVVGGVIDSDYRGEIAILMHNFGYDHYFYEKGQRIAQLLILPYFSGIPLAMPMSDTKRGSDGFGSTGV